MPWSAVAPKIEFWTSSSTWGGGVGTLSATDQGRIAGALQIVYEGSETARLMIDAWIDAGHTIRIGGLSAGAIGAAFGVDGPAGARYVGFNAADIDNLYYFNDKGALVQEIFGLTIIHEMIHMMKGIKDLLDRPATEFHLNLPDYDQQGATLPWQNQIAEELGRTNNIQIGYAEGFLTSDPRAGEVAVNYSYSEGQAVTNVRTGRLDALGNAVDDNLDHSRRTDDSVDLMLGLDGDDQLSGGGGNDYLYGGMGQDVLRGGSGNDLLHGADVLIPGADEIDTADYSLGDDGLAVPAGITVDLDFSAIQYRDGRPILTVTDDGYGGTDRLISIERIVATDHSDVFNFSGELEASLLLNIVASPTSAGVNDMIDLSGSTTGYTVSAFADGVGVQSRTGGGAVVIEGFVGDIIGSEQNDALSGGVNVSGGGGSDLLAGCVDADGGEGNDYLNGGDYLYGGAGTDRLTGGGLMNGGAGDDWYSGGGVIEFESGGGHDYLDSKDDAPFSSYILDLGEASLSSLQIGREMVLISTEEYTLEGIDEVFQAQLYRGRVCLMIGSTSVEIGTCVTRYDTGDEYFMGQQGISNPTPWTFGMDEVNRNITIRTSDGDVSLDAVFDQWDLFISPFYSGRVPPGPVVGASHFPDARETWENSYSGPDPEVTPPPGPTDGDDTLLGGFFGGLADFVGAVAGVIVDLGSNLRQETGGSGADQLIGFDAVRGSAYADTLTAAYGSSSVEGAGGDDAIEGREGDDYLDGGDGDDVVFGNGGADSMYGGEGGDEMYAGAGDDFLSGDAGDDQLSGGEGSDSLYGGDGFDQANFAGSVSQFSFVRDAYGGVVATDTLGLEGVDFLDGIEAVYFAGSASWHYLSELVGDYGTEGSDPWLEGTAGQDALFGLGGDDQIIGRGGDDTIDGGEGDDQAVYLGDFADFTFTRQADGSVRVQDTTSAEGVDTLISVESVYFQGSSTWALVNDLVADYGTSDNDAWLEGTSASEAIYGLEGDDVLVGREGDDTLFGGEGEDQATYFGSSTDFTFTLNPDGTVTVTDTVGDEGSDILDGVEALYFAGDSTWMTVEDALSGAPRPEGRALLDSFWTEARPEFLVLEDAMARAGADWL